MEAKGNFMIGNGRDSLAPSEDERLTILRSSQAEKDGEPEQYEVLDEK